MGTEIDSAALDAGNRVFHDAYRRARDDARGQVPVLVVLPDELALHFRGQRQSTPYSCPSFGTAKSAAHIAVALFALTHGEPDAARNGAAMDRLLGSISAALDRKQAQGLDREPLQVVINALLEQCLLFAQVARELPPSHDLCLEFASDIGPRILHVTELATCEQVASLHGAADTALQSLSVAEQAELQVVVVGDHQARTRSLGMQYFKRRFQEPPGADIRVTYGENISDEQEAISLVATRRLDQLIAHAFFGDEARLQRDVLGDAATRCLDRMHFPSPVSA